MGLIWRACLVGTVCFVIAGCSCCESTEPGDEQIGQGVPADNTILTAAIMQPDAQNGRAVSRGVIGPASFRR